MKPFCACVDWGTTSFRLWLVDGDGEVLASRKAPDGITKCFPDRFHETLEQHLKELKAPKELPVVICGMAGSKQGWREADYIDLPARLSEIASSPVSIKHDTRDVRILPGLAQRKSEAPDVIRGEETQLLGIQHLFSGSNSVCQPGTHSKWIHVEEASVTGFTTFMTGELFAAISQHTILQHSIEAEAGFDDASFVAGLERAQAQPMELTAHLFGLRAGGLLYPGENGDGASWLSGLLIGMEIAAIKPESGTHAVVDLISEGILAQRYALAFETTAISYRLHDSEVALQRGLYEAASAIWPDRKG